MSLIQLAWQDKITLSGVILQLPIVGGMYLLNRLIAAAAFAAFAD